MGSVRCLREGPSATSMSTPFNLVARLTEERDRGAIVWLLNIGAEKYWNPVQPGVVDRGEDRIVGRVEEMNLLLCREQDILILREMPDPYYLDKLREWGFSIPRRIRVPRQSDSWTPISELVLRDVDLLTELAKVAEANDDVWFVPYAVTRLEEQIAARCGLRLAAAPSGVNAAVNDKIANREIAVALELPVCQGRVCGSAEEIGQAYAELTEQPPYFDRVIIKEPFGASGKGLYIVDGPDKLRPILLRVSRFAKSNPQAQWLVEGWYDKQADINYQLYVSEDGKVDVFSIKQQVLRDTVYIGSRMPVELGADAIDRYREFGEAIGKHLHAIGFTGVAGIDSIITRDGGVIPIIEINGRFTLSTYISFLERVIGDAKVFSRYFKVATDEPVDFRAVCEELERERLLYSRDTGEGVLVYTSGTLPTVKDESSGKYPGRVFTLIVARDWERVEEIGSRLESLLDSWQYQLT
ncbi:peptide ligase PGM1-related protein [Cohnella panacarvi]|uniref:peptide ligase PGM1-related protein n=1 Tax=Cohnella panacarvi TaxID=400776 RepID=UPI000478EC47|nr:peptide ligase PGM1-related protein [Cohnella panacarvi]